MTNKFRSESKNNACQYDQLYENQWWSFFYEITFNLYKQYIE